MMGTLSWLTGVGIPSLVGFALLAGAAWAWFQIPALGKYIGLALACVGVAILANAKGFSDARALCNEAAARAELMSVRRDLDTAHEAQARAAGQAVALREAERINEELADEIAALPDDCVADDSHIKRLLRIR